MSNLSVSDQCEDVDLIDPAYNLLREEDARTDDSDYTEDSDPEEVINKESSAEDNDEEIYFTSLSIVDHGIVSSGSLRITIVCTQIIETDEIPSTI